MPSTVVYFHLLYQEGLAKRWQKERSTGSFNANSSHKVGSHEEFVNSLKKASNQIARRANGRFISIIELKIHHNNDRFSKIKIHMYVYKFNYIYIINVL